MRNKYVILFVSVMVLLLVPCAYAFAAASPEPTNKTIKREIKMGLKASQEIEKEMPRVLDPAKEARLAVIAGRLTPYMGRELSYDVRIVSMDEFNAFSLPGGITYITTKMLDSMTNDAEIAAVLAHEFVHADRAHALVQSARNNRLSILTIAGIIAAAQGAGAGAAIAAGAMQTAIMNSYSIDLEKEADARGIDVLRKAGYNPTAMLVLMEKMKMETLKHKSYADLGIMQTHPEDEERINAAIKYMKDNGIEVQRKKITKKLKTVVAMVSGDIKLVIDGTDIVSLPYSQKSKEFLNELKNRLDNTIELELAPYDIYVSSRYGTQILSIKGKKILSSSELLPGMPKIIEIRNRINKVIIDARSKNPLTDYFQ
jgi:predicted Zn-dependent protease